MNRGDGEGGAAAGGGGGGGGGVGGEGDGTSSSLTERIPTIMMGGSSFPESQTLASGHPGSDNLLVVGSTPPVPNSEEGSSQPHTRNSHTQRPLPPSAKHTHRHWCASSEAIEELHTSGGGCVPPQSHASRRPAVLLWRPVQSTTGSVIITEKSYQG